MLFPELILLLAIPALLGFWAQHHVGSTYAKWARVGSRGKMTGAEVAAAVMRAAGITNIEIVEIPGHLTDHYDPAGKRLALSTENYRGRSLAALGVAAHEAGHALQDKVGFPALHFRMGLVPLTNFACALLPFIMLGGLVFHRFGFIYLGIGIYVLLTVLQFVTLPVEFDASRRALNHLKGLGILDAQEMVGARETLKAAAWTYVAAFVAAFGNLIYLVMAVTGNRRA